MTSTAKREATEMARETKKAKNESATTTASGLVTYATNEKFLKLLTQSKVDFIRPADNRVFVAQRTDKVVDVFKGLIEHNFLSVPVMQKTKNKYYGFIDLWDIVKFVTAFFGETEELKTSEDFFKLAEKSEQLKQKTVNDVMTYPLSKRNPFHPVTSGYSLFAAIEPLAREVGLHRVPVVDKERKLITMITQSQIVHQVLLKNMDLIGEKKNKPVNQTHRYMEAVYCVSEDMIAMDAFKMMIEKNVTGLAVVNADGALLTNLSVSDLKGMSADGRLFWRLYQPIKTYIQKLRAETPARPPLVFLKENDTLETAIKLLAEHKVHRIYMVDEVRKPVGVLSLKDILLEVIEDSPHSA